MNNLKSCILKESDLIRRFLDISAYYIKNTFTQFFVILGTAYFRIFLYTIFEIYLKSLLGIWNLYQKALGFRILHTILGLCLAPHEYVASTGSTISDVSVVYY